MSVHYPQWLSVIRLSAVGILCHPSCGMIDWPTRVEAITAVPKAHSFRKGAGANASEREIIGESYFSGSSEFSAIIYY